MGKEKQMTVESPLTIGLFDSGMTALHKVGLAGLWMTLKVLDTDKAAILRRPTGCGWELGDHAVKLVWDGNLAQFLAWLIDESFKLDKKGLFWFPALGEPIANPQQAVVLQSAVLGSFLQHGRTRKADKSIEAGGSLSVTVDDAPLVVTYRRVQHYAHQDADFPPDGLVRLAGWHFPGGAVRHTGLGNTTALEEPLGRTLALQFAVVGAVYFEVRRRGQGTRTAYSIVLPEVTDLSAYARARALFVRYGIQQLVASGSADAGMRVLAELHAAGILADVRSASCRVVSFGVVPWSSQQKTRVQLLTVRPGSAEGLRTYAACRAVLSPKLVRREDKPPFWDVPLVPDMVARNAASGQPWYIGFADLVADKDRREHVFRYERGGLTKMVDDSQTMPEGADRTFILACQEALRRYMGQKFGRAGGADWGTEFEKVRVSFARCKNAHTLRETMTDFWARGGALHQGDKSLLKSEGLWWQQVLPLFNEKNWRRAKDLALLALASYPGGKEEDK